MTNYEYILNECRKAHYYGWKAEVASACVEILNNCSRSELQRLFTSRWLDKESEVRKAIFNLLFGKQLEKRATMIREASIDELGAMLMDKDGNYVKLARQELKNRYKTVAPNTQMMIIRFFMHGTTKQDVKWGEVREKWQKRGYANPPSTFDTWKKYY